MLLIELRKERGLRQIDLAEKLGMSQQFVSRYEEGQKVLDLPELGQIVKALNVTLIEFVQMYESRKITIDTVLTAGAVTPK